MNSTVRPMKLSEVDEVVQLWRRLASDHTLIIDDENLTRFREFLEGLSKEDENQVLVYEMERRIVGFLTFMKKARSMLRLRRSRAMITDLYVEEEYRGQGIASKLLERCLQYLKSMGVEEVRVNVLVDNAPAISLYRKLGFADHMILMSRPLQSAAY